MESISILIPIFNYNVVPFIDQLINTFEKTKLNFEIICIDDCSTNNTIIDQNNVLKHYNHVQYQLLNQNIGRTKIRSLLANKASYKWLLFFDCDLKIENIDTFGIKIERNLHSEESNIYAGGIKYEDQKPLKQDLYLHWLIGKNKEEKSALKRSKLLFNSFNFNNLLIEKSTFFSVQPSVSVTNYGHEDTLFGMELKQHNYSIIHYDNSVIHIGLVSNQLFLLKTESAIINLVKIYNCNQLMTDLKIIYFYNKVEFILDLINDNILRFLINKFKKNLVSQHPRMMIFDFYKLFLFHLQYKKSLKL